MSKTVPHYLIDFTGSTSSYGRSPLSDLPPKLASIQVEAPASASEIAAEVRAAIDATLSRHAASLPGPYGVLVDFETGTVQVFDSIAVETVHARGVVTGPGVGPADHPHADLIAGLREMASLLESRPDLAVYQAHLSVGALDSRAQLEAWSAELDAEITMGGTAGDIPVIWHSMPAFEFNAQAPAEPEHNRLARAEAEIARLRAELATRTESDR